MKKVVKTNKLYTQDCVKLMNLMDENSVDLTVANKHFLSGKTDLSIKLLEQMRDQIELLAPLGIEGGFADDLIEEIDILIGNITS